MELIRQSDIARRIGVSRQLLRLMLLRGELPQAAVFDPVLLWDKAVIEQWAKERAK